MIVPEGFVTYKGNVGPPDLMRRVRYIDENMLREGHRHTTNECYRPLGEPGDEYITDASKTSTKSSNVYFQYGRMLRGETPEAANPFAGQVSAHTRGIAADMDSSSIERRNAWAARVGMARTIRVETWHYEIVGPIEAGLHVPFITDIATPSKGKYPMEFLAEVKDFGATYLRNPNGFLHVDPDTRDAYMKAGVPVVKLSGKEWTNIANSTNKVLQGSELLSQTSYRDYRAGKK